MGTAIDNKDTTARRAALVQAHGRVPLHEWALLVCALLAACGVVALLLSGGARTLLGLAASHTGALLLRNVVGIARAACIITVVGAVALGLDGAACAAMFLSPRSVARLWCRLLPSVPSAADHTVGVLLGATSRPTASAASRRVNWAASFVFLLTCVRCAGVVDLSGTSSLQAALQHGIGSSSAAAGPSASSNNNNNNNNDASTADLLSLPAPGYPDVFLCAGLFAYLVVSFGASVAAARAAPGGARTSSLTPGPALDEFDPASIHKTCDDGNGEGWSKRIPTGAFAIGADPAVERHASRVRIGTRVLAMAVIAVAVATLPVAMLSQGGTMLSVSAGADADAAAPSAARAPPIDLDTDSGQLLGTTLILVLAQQWAAFAAAASATDPWKLAFMALAGAMALHRVASAAGCTSRGGPRVFGNDSGANPHTDPSIVTASQRSKDAARERTYPPNAAFPNGYYKLMNSNELKPGDVKQVSALGVELAVYRGRNDKRVAVLDAYCPHLGAHLAVGGKVEGDCLECPFHRWQFNGDGSVAKIPYSSSIPSVAKTRSWPCVEYYGQVLVYYDADGRDPAYLPPTIADIADGSLTHRGTHTGPRTRMHLQEFAENSVDFAHFEPLHGRMMVPWTSYEVPLIHIQHTPDWYTEKAPQGHIAHFINAAQLKVFGKLIPKTNADADITFVGPGGLVYFRFTIEDLGTIVMFQTHLPLETMLVETQFSWFADRAIPDFLVSYVVGNWVSQWANDLEVWSNKRYNPKPVLCRGDGPVAKLRRWYSQFYSSGAPRLQVGSGAGVGGAAASSVRGPSGGGAAASASGGGADEDVKAAAADEEAAKGRSKGKEAARPAVAGVAAASLEW